MCVGVPAKVLTKEEYSAIVDVMGSQMTVGIIFVVVFALIGFAIGAVKIPIVAGIPITKKIGGESLDQIILNYFKFKKNRKLYVYTKEEKN